MEGLTGDREAEERMRKAKGLNKVRREKGDREREGEKDEYKLSLNLPV